MTTRNGALLRAWLAAAITGFVLAGCGGGGDGGDAAPVVTTPPGVTAPTVQILDSFNREVIPGSGGDGVGVGDSGGDGTAGEGAAIVGGVVTIIDLNGKSVSATTDAQGYYRVKLTGFAPPFVAKVTKPDGKVLHSLNVKSTKVNGFIAINITGLTDKIASDVAKAGGKPGAAALTPQIVSDNPKAITDSLNQLRSRIAPVLADAGIAESTFDPLSVPFRPDRTGYDKVLDNVVVTVGTDGQTQLAVSPKFVPAGSLTGTWSVTARLVFSDPSIQPFDTAPNDVPGTGVPKDQATAAAFCSNGLSQVVDTGGGTTATVNCSGNTVTVTSADGSGTVTFTLVSYQGCGACGVGSTVVVVFSMHQVFTAGNSSTSVTTNVTNTYTRKS